jgi:ribosomal protein S1
MKIGDIIKAEILDSGEGYVNLSCGEYRGTLMQTEISWDAGLHFTCRELALADSLIVRVTAVEGKRISVSMKRVSENPWDNPPLIGDKFLVPVVRLTEYGYFVRITWYCNAFLPINDALKSHALGASIVVKIEEVDLDHERIIVKEIHEQL